MTILDKIIAHKRKELIVRKSLTSIKQLEGYPGFSDDVTSFSQSIQSPERSGIIAEFKRESPSKGIINNRVNVTEVVRGYEQAGASALSVLTDMRFFGGTVYDVGRARQATSLPVLRKDFIVDEFQIVEAKAIGASAILLIASVLSAKEIHNLATMARGLGLEVLLELHDRTEIGKISPKVNAVGVNNRDLRTFQVDIRKSEEMAALIPDEFIKVSESGISDVEVINCLREYGYEGFLIGENFMREENPGQACKEIIDGLIHNTLVNFAKVNVCK